MTVIEAINDTAKALTNLSKTLVENEELLKAKPAAVAADIKPKETPKKTEISVDTAKAPVTIEQIRAVMAEKSQAGLTAKVKELLESFGAAKLSAVNPDDYEALLEAAKEIK